jgi:HEAT repeat protein
MMDAEDPNSSRDRARDFLVSGTDAERMWALEYVGMSTDRPAAFGVARLLDATVAPLALRLLAAATLGRLKDPSVVPSLDDCLKADPPAEVRRACVQALHRIGRKAALETLLKAGRDETDPVVAAEIAHAVESMRSSR